MERLAIEIGVVVIVFILGYWMGFRACFEFMDEEIKRRQDENNG